MNITIGQPNKIELQTYNEPRLDNIVGAILETTHTIAQDAEQRGIDLVNLKILENTVHQLQWHQHTSDCDWLLNINYKDGDTEQTSEDFQSWELLRADGTTILISPNNNFTACTDFDQITHLQFFSADDGESIFTLPVADIISFTYTQE